jgi:excisionase family DNA binding protein
METKLRYKGLLTIEELSELYGVKPSWIHRQTTKGGLPHLKLAGRLRFDPKAVDDWIDQFKRKPQPQIRKG